MGHCNPAFSVSHSLRSIRPLVAAAALMFGIALNSHAQDTGSISGTVTDKTGAAVVGANLVIANTAGSLTRTTVTNGDGAYVAAGLPGATYDISVTANGFQKYTAHGVVLDVTQKIRVDVQLTVGSVSEGGVVAGERAVSVWTSSSGLGAG